MAVGDNAWYAGGWNSGQVAFQYHEYTTDGGSSWTGGSTLPTAMGQGMGGGAYNSAIMGGGGEGATGGGAYTQSYTYDGSSWTSQSNFSGIRGNLGGGDSTDAITIAGRSGGGTYEAYSEIYNGSTWVSGGATLGNGRYEAGTDASSGTNGLLAGGYVNSPYNSTTNDSQSLSGTTWSTVGTMNQVCVSSTLAGDNTDALLWGSDRNTKDLVSEYTPTTWTSLGSLFNSGIYSAVGGGDSTDAFSIGGYDTTASSVTNYTASWGGTSWTSATVISNSVQQAYGDYVYV